MRTDSYSSQTRNKLIAEAFYLTKAIEKYGSGYIRIRKEISQYTTMTFNYNEMGNGFLAELAYTEQKINSALKTPLKTPLKTTQKIPLKTPLKIPLKIPLKGAKRTIVEMLTEQPDATQEYIANRTERNIFTIKKHFKWLIVNGYLKRIGPDKGGYWEVLKK